MQHEIWDILKQIFMRNNTKCVGLSLEICIRKHSKRNESFRNRNKSFYKRLSYCWHFKISSVFLLWKIFVSHLVFFNMFSNHELGHRFGWDCYLHWYIIKYIPFLRERGYDTSIIRCFGEWSTFIIHEILSCCNLTRCHSHFTSSTPLAHGICLIAISISRR